MTPVAFPAYSLLSAFGRGAPVNLEYQQAGRVLPFPFHFLDNNKAMNVRPKNYSWLEFYDNLIFHRVMPEFMVQCGGFKPDMSQPPTHETIRNEARADVGNERGTLAMARTSAPHSASAQFYINLVNNTGLNKGRAADGFGYCVFGKVTEGMAVVDRIAQVETTTVGGHENVPKQPVLIKSIRRAE